MNAQQEWKHYRREHHFSLLHLSGGVSYNLRQLMYKYRREAALERRIEAHQREIKAASSIIEYAYVVLGNGDFKNGVTDCSGSIDEGEVHAGRCFEMMRQWLLHHETTQNYIRSEFTSTERQHERREQLDSWSDEMPLGIALDGLGDSVE